MYDIAAGHAPALSAEMVFLALGLVFLWLLRVLAGRQAGWSARFLEGFDASPPMAKLAAALMLVSGAVHLALVPGHEGITGLLFIIDGLGFIALALGVFTTTWWRRPAALWLSATIVAYLVWVIAGWEAPDQVGIACKLIELIALGLIMRLKNPPHASWPRRLWRATAFPLLVSLTTLGIWIGGLGHPHALHAHAGAVLQPVASVANPEGRAAGARPLAATADSPTRHPEAACVDNRHRHQRAVRRRPRQSRPAPTHGKVIAMKPTTPAESRLDIAGVLVVLQASLSLTAGLSAIPFGIVEPGFRVLSVVTIVVAGMMFWLSRNLRRGRRWAWRGLLTLEVLSLTITVLLTLLPIGTIRGPVPVLVNLVIPWAVLVLLASGSRRSAGPRPGPADPD